MSIRMMITATAGTSEKKATWAAMLLAAETIPTTCPYRPPSQIEGGAES